MRTNPHETADLVTFSEEILNGKPYFFVQGSTVLFTKTPRYECHFAPILQFIS